MKKIRFGDLVREAGRPTTIELWTAPEKNKDLQRAIRTNRVIFIAFILSALCVALAGLIRLSQVAGASVNSGLGIELSVVTAVVLGGASLSGGRGGIGGTVLAVLIVGVLANGLIQLNVPSFWIEVANGLLLLGAVTVDRVRVRLTRADV